jgi:type IV secretory pathway VirB2 component (pilin)
MRFWIVVAGMMGLLLTGEGRVNAQTKPDESVVGRIAVTAKGTVSFDGAVITIDAFK